MATTSTPWTTCQYIQPGLTAWERTWSIEVKSDLYSIKKLTYCSSKNWKETFPSLIYSFNKRTCLRMWITTINCVVISVSSLLWWTVRCKRQCFLKASYPLLLLLPSDDIFPLKLQSSPVPSLLSPPPPLSDWVKASKSKGMVGAGVKTVRCDANSECFWQ